MGADVRWRGWRSRAAEVSQAMSEDNKTPDGRTDSEAMNEPSLEDDVGNAPVSSEVLRVIAHAPSRRPRTKLAPGTPWGPDRRYLITRRLGRGGMGTVYA